MLIILVLEIEFKACAFGYRYSQGEQRVSFSSSIHPRKRLHKTPLHPHRALPPLPIDFAQQNI